MSANIKKKKKKKKQGPKELRFRS